jgi:hypothetical protein
MPECDNQPNRIRAVFGLAEDAPLPRVQRNTLHRFYEHLTVHVAVPFDGLYAETKPPIRRLVHYIRVLKILEVPDRLSEGLLCQAQNMHHTLELPLAEVGVREDDPNYQLIDDYAYWFLNRR